MIKYLAYLLFVIILFQGINSESYQAYGRQETPSVLNFQINPELIPAFNLLSNDVTTPIDTENIIYMENQRVINAINPGKQDNVNNYYPGLRGPNQLVIYTPIYGTRTGTNEYGTEAIVENNMVVGLNGADSIIPPNGFVISGHGRAKTWIMQNIQIGTKVYIDYKRNIVKCYLTPESLIFAVKEKIKEVNSLVDFYKQTSIFYNDKISSSYIQKSKELLRKAEIRPEKTQTYITEAVTFLDEAIKNALPYFKSELKGVWIRPVEDTPEKIEKTIDRIQEAGITDIFLETYFHGKTIYDSDFLRKNGVISQREEFAGFDPLKIWIKEAHKRKMKLHVWFECFYVGNDNPKITPNHILKQYPMWANKRFINYDSKAPVPSLSEHNGYFLDPANAEVQAFLLGIIDEITEKYKPDGINLDYIRYPQTVDSAFPNYASLNWGYTQTAREQFLSIYGIDPINIKYGTSDWELWSLFRQNKISDFVKKVKQCAKPHNITVTAVIFPDLRKCIDTKMQNWKLWSQKNYVDGFTPLILTGDKNTAVILLKDIKENVNPATKIYPGIFVPFMGGTFEDLLIQIHKTREINSKGAVIFDYAHLNDKYIDAIKTRAFNDSYDENQIKAPLQDYKPKVKYKDKKSKKRRKANDRN